VTLSSTDWFRHSVWDCSIGACAHWPTCGEAQPEGPAVAEPERAVFEWNGEQHGRLDCVVDDDCGDHQYAGQRQHEETTRRCETQQHVGDTPRQQRGPLNKDHYITITHIECSEEQEQTTIDHINQSINQSTRILLSVELWVFRFTAWPAINLSCRYITTQVILNAHRCDVYLRPKTLTIEVCMWSVRRYALLDANAILRRPRWNTRECRRLGTADHVRGLRCSYPECRELHQQRRNKQLRTSLERWDVCGCIKAARRWTYTVVVWIYLGAEKLRFEMRSRLRCFKLVGFCSKFLKFILLRPVVNDILTIWRLIRWLSVELQTTKVTFTSRSV